MKNKEEKLLEGTIPKEFTLFASKYNIELDDKPTSEQEALGLFGDNDKKIVLAISRYHTFLPVDTVVETYYHELAHCLCKQTGNKIWKDEVFVDLLGKLFMQYLSTVKF